MFAHPKAAVNARTYKVFHFLCVPFTVTKSQHGVSDRKTSQPSRAFEVQLFICILDHFTISRNRITEVAKVVTNLSMVGDLRYKHNLVT